MRLVYQPDLNGFVRRLIHRTGPDLPEVYWSFSYYPHLSAIPLKLLDLDGYTITSPLRFNWSCSPGASSAPIRLTRKMQGLVLQVVTGTCFKPLPEEKYFD